MPIIILLCFIIIALIFSIVGAKTSYDIRLSDREQEKFVAGHRRGKKL